MTGAEDVPAVIKPCTSHVSKIHATDRYTYQRDDTGLEIHGLFVRSDNHSALTSTFQRVRPVQASIRIHRSPWSYVVIVTQFVTHPHR